MAKLAIINICIVLISIILVCCNTNDNTYTTPRPKGFARIPTYDSTYISISHENIHFEINSSTLVTRNSLNPQWYNISYPKYNAILYCSFTPTTKSSIDNIINNRIERISLNIGDNIYISTDLKNGYNFTSTILRASTGTANPIQFISTDNDSWVVSGSLFIANFSTYKNDSLYPIIDAVERDLIHALKNIKPQKDE